jgi:hypothetical protein
MKPKKEMIPELNLSENFRLAMTQEGLTFKDLEKRSKVSDSTGYRLVERTPVFITNQLIAVGKALGFTEKQVREKSREDRVARRFSYSRKERLYRLVAEILDLFGEMKERS